MQRAPTPRALAALLLVATLAGCGGGSHHSGGMMGGSGGMMNGGQAGTPTGSPTQTQPAGKTPNGKTEADTGRALFLASGCGGCHTLAAAHATGSAGPNLDRTRPRYADVIEQVTSGGGAMPAYGNSLTEPEIAAIARYVSTSTR